MNATITLESKVDVGSKFIICFNDIELSHNIDIKYIETKKPISLVLTKSLSINSKFLHHRLIPLFEEAKKTGSIQDIRDCNILLDYVSKYIDSKEIVDLNARLNIALESFNIEEIEQILEEFSHIRKDL